MTRLSVNVNKIALLRNARDLSLNLPNVSQAAEIILKAGAYGITVHPRPDQRHIRYDDAFELADLVKGFENAEYNIEGNPFTGRYMEVVKQIKPDQATLVPDAPGANTSDHGWNIQKDGDRLVPVIKELKDNGIRVSLFMDPDKAGIELAQKINADRIELYTEPYATAFRTNQNLDQTLASFAAAAKFAQSTGLDLNAGHDLNLKNLQKFCTTVPGILEVSIGHALIAEALETGLYNTVKDYLNILAKC